MRDKVAAVILAAGASTRLGQPKQLLDWGGRPLVVHAADTVWCANLEPLVVVLGAHAEQIAPTLRGRPVHVVHNYRWQEGMSTSLNAGLSVLSPDVEAVVFLPVDQPLVTSRALRELVRCWQMTPADIVASAAGDGRRGTPALFGRALFPELATLSGEMGGRALFDRYVDRLVTLPVDNPYALGDVDTPEQWVTLREHAQDGGREENLLAGIRGIICDMDGVLWRNQTPLPGLEVFFKLISDLGLRFKLATNNSSRTPQMYADKLSGMGVPASTDHILTSSLATAAYLAEQAMPGASVYVVGSTGVFEALRSRGFSISDGGKADYVVVGWDQALTWEKLATATRLIQNGAGFIGTNPDLTYPLETYLAPGNGAQLAALEASTGITPTIVGKPYPTMYRQALAQMELGPEETLVIGDRLDTDILGGIRLGMPTALVLSGVSHPDDLKATPIQPDMIFENLAALVALVRSYSEI